MAALAAAKDEVLPRELEGVGVEEHLGAKVDLNLEFVNTGSRVIALKSLFQSGRPVLLNMVYYSCPMLCNRVLNAQNAALQDVPWTPGNEFEMVTITIDPTETAQLASAKRQQYLENYGRPAPGWHFLADYRGNAARLAGQLGFKYTFDGKQYAHPAAIFILTPDGTISRYLYGVKFKPMDIRLALTEAAAGRFGMSFEKLLLFCFHYDPQAKSYVPFARNFMRAGGAIVAGLLGFILLRLWSAERRNGSRPVAPADHMVATK